jgi:hypothetical protein
MSFNQNKPSVSLSTSASIPDRLSEQEARSILEQHRPSYESAKEEETRVNDRADQGQQTVIRLAAQAKETFGVSTPEEVQRLQDERMKKNSDNVRAFLQQKETFEASMRTLKSGTSLS